MGSFPEMHNLVVNSNHPLISKIISIEDDSEKSKLAKQATDLALLSVGLLKGKELTNFIKRSVDVLA
jgi:molecular chaperone HtpG